MRNMEFRPKQEPNRESGILKVIDVEPEEELEILKKFKEKFQHPDLPPEIQKIEKEKTPEEVEIIEGINGYLPEFINEYGGQPLKVSPENIIFLDESKFTEKQKKHLIMEEPTCRIYPLEQIVVVFPPYPEKYPLVKLEMARMLTHELLHFNSFMSLRKKEEELKTRQGGIEINLPKKEMNFLGGLNEAIIEEMAIKFIEKYFPHIPPLKEGIQEREEFINSLPTTQQENARQEIAYVFTEQLPSGEYKTTIKGYNSYREERKALQDILKKIYSKNQARFSSPEEVFQIFVSATLLGNLPQIARLIEQNLGKGSFKKVAQKFSRPYEYKNSQKPTKI